MKRFMWIFKDLVLFLIELVTITYLLHNKIGKAAFIGLGLVFIAAPIQGKRDVRSTYNNSCCSSKSKGRIKRIV